jgi:hypothetical protein
MSVAADAPILSALNIKIEQSKEEDPASTAVPCEEIFNRAISLNESYKKAVTSGGQRAFGFEAENYFNTVLLKRITGCTAYASANSDAALSQLLFDLAYSYSSSDNEIIPRELAKLYSNDPQTTKTILLNSEKNKRHELIEILQRGLNNLYHGKDEYKKRLEDLKQLLDKLESN